MIKELHSCDEEIITTILSAKKIFPLDIETRSDFYILEWVQKRLIKPALVLLNIISNDNSKKHIKEHILHELIKQNDPEYFSEIVKQFSIQLKHALIYTDKNNNYHSLWSAISDTSSEFQQNYLKTLKKQKLNPDSEIFHPDFCNTLGITPLMSACNVADQESVDLLLKYGADINRTLTRNDTKNLVNPFRLAHESGNINFIQHIVQQGADPLKLPLIIYGNRCIENANIPSAPVTGKASLEKTLKNKDFITFNQQYMAIIEKALVYKVLESIQAGEISKAAKSEEVLNKEKEDPKSTTRENEPNKVEKPIAPDKQEVIAANSIPEEDTQTTLINNYIAFKKDTKTIENEFDLLLLQYTKDCSEDNLTELHDFIQENPELNLYPVTKLIKSDNSSKNISNDILINTPKLLHKFFSLKKECCETLTQTESAIPKEGVFVIESTLSNKAYITISPGLQEDLKTNNSEFLKSITDQLPHCKFVTSNSHGQSGLKQHNGMIRLKIANEDLSIYTQTMHKDSQGNLLIILDSLRAHKDKMPKSPLKTITVDNFNDKWAELGLTVDNINKTDIDDTSTTQGPIDNSYHAAPSSYNPRAAEEVEDMPPLGQNGYEDA